MVTALSYKRYIVFAAIDFDTSPIVLLLPPRRPNFLSRLLMYCYKIVMVKG